MKLRVLTKKLVDEKLAMPIYTALGTVLLSAGNTLTEKVIAKLQELGVVTVYVEDNTYAIELQEMLEAKLRIELIKDIKEVFDEIKKNKKLNEILVESIVTRVIENINMSENAFLINNISGEKKVELEFVLYSFEVMIYSLVVGATMKLNVKKLTNLGIGALLHDVGRLWKEDESHARAGYDFIKASTKIPTTSYVCILQHHEYEDGSGYPEGLKGDKIYELSKIVGICSEYVDLLRNYNFKLPNEVIEIMTAKAVLKYDHETFRRFVKAIYCYPNGLEVKLSSEIIGIVIKQNKDLPTRPVVAVLEQGKPIAVDLTTPQNQTVFIEEVLL